MTPILSLSRNLALAAILVAPPALAVEAAHDTAGISPSAFAASELMLTAKSDIGTQSSTAMGKVAKASADGNTSAAAALGGSYAADLAFDDDWGTLSADGRVETHEVAFAVVHFADIDDREPLERQAAFLLQHQGEDGALPNGFTLKRKAVVADTTPRTLLAQTAAIQAFLAAWDVTGNEQYRKAARKGYMFLQHALWAPEAGVYRGAERARETTYDGLLLGSTVGAFRELAKAHTGPEREELAGRLDAVWLVVAKQGDPLAGVTLVTRR